MLKRLCENCQKPTGGDFYVVKDNSNIWRKPEEMPDRAICLLCYDDGKNWFAGRKVREELEDLTAIRRQIMEQFPDTAANPVIARRIFIRHSDAPVDIFAENETEYDELLQDLLRRTFAAEVEKIIELPLPETSLIPGVYWVETGTALDNFRPDSIPISPYPYEDKTIRSQRFLKIKIYYSDVIPADGFDEHDGKMIARDIDETKLKYHLVWQGTSEEIGETEAEDAQLLEFVYDYFNDEEPEHFMREFRSLSTGDVVCLEDRCYLCQTSGWRKLDEFNCADHKDRFNFCQYKSSR